MTQEPQTKSSLTDRDDHERILLSIEFLGEAIKQRSMSSQETASALDGYIRSAKDRGVTDDTVIEYINYMNRRIAFGGPIGCISLDISPAVVEYLNSRKDRPIEGTITDEFVERVGQALRPLAYTPIRTDAYKRVAASLVNRYPDYVKSEVLYNKNIRLAADILTCKVMLWAKGLVSTKSDDQPSLGEPK